MVDILAFCGSARQGSFNQMAVNAVASHLTGNVTHVNLRDYDIPLYDGDLEAKHGQPPAATRFREQVASHRALLIGCPEYNGFMTPLLLNALNWATRTPDGKPDLSPFTGKPVMIVSASPGALAGLRAATHLRTMLSGIGCHVLPENFSVAAAMNAFDEGGALTDEGQAKRAASLAAKFEDYAERLQTA